MGRSAAIVETGTMELHQSHFPFGRIPLHSNSWILASANSMEVLHRLAFMSCRHLDLPHQVPRDIPKIPHACAF